MTMTARREIKFAPEDGPFVRWLYRFADRWAFVLLAAWAALAAIVVALVVASYVATPEPDPTPTPAYSFCDGKAVVGPCSLSI